MKRKEDEFYIGYLNNIPVNTKRYLKKTTFILIIVVAISAIIFSISQKKFENGTFELQNITEITGTLYKKPYPMLRVPTGENSFKNILLLGFGKFGAENDLQKIEENISIIDEKEITLRGNLIYYDGKTLLQINDDIENYHIKKSSQKRANPVALGKVTLKGEVIDPKCYFGVMKPGFGKIHRSCAIRCISGGIPPVFISTNTNGDVSYYLITDVNGGPINNDILPYIGKPSKIKATVDQLEDWMVLKVNVDDIELTKSKSKIY